MLSIVIPTLNEEDYLPALLESIKRQDFYDYEIIVADAGSKDDTVQIAQKYGAYIVEGGLPAKGRNNGATVARGELLFFLDADTLLPDHFLEKSLAEFKQRKLDIASFCLILYPEEKKSAFLIEFFYNKMILAMEHVLPHAAVGILITKKLFDSVGGYDQSITLAEDHDLGRRAARRGKFGIIRSQRFFFSDRRFKKEGWLRVGLKYFLGELHTVFIGPVRSGIFNYKFNHYNDNKK